MGSRVQGARERARIEIVAAIKAEARRQLASDGAAKLSLRAVARELGMVSSALYRYFPSRDDLLTALITDAYDAVGEAAEQATAGSGGAADSPPARWLAVCRAVRAWALEHPHEYALIYGSPVPGYAAPQSTTVAASRGALVMFGIAQDAYDSGALREPTRGSAAPDALARDMAEIIERLDIRLPAPLVVELVAAWSELFGLISSELFGQFNRVVTERDAFFGHAVARLADQVGLGGGSAVLPGE
ncbi:TetR/AcrR family transcriptional regulator [Streptomyces boncukensis]|uniref:TetR/AcrR family transcriptional regulator n=1 Tax=Streptomyces boncukensis TaxID=2711219 RepID=A0A6G4X3K4_9ACTN|nr:TetR/AcrR family transcriptional regulator [Streptomyces boncukensis]NGO71968.1 TetR/AcrR family transcriptional regulator [Streptomyces boncukensis]